MERRSVWGGPPLPRFRIQLPPCRSNEHGSGRKPAYKGDKGRAQARRLGDLFVVGREVTFDDGQGAPISVYVRKLNTSEHERALRRANSERSKVLAAKTDKDSDLHR